MEELVIQNGAKLVKSVSKKTSLLWQAINPDPIK
jgi:NAD-dependent DNA ligase